MQRRHFLQRPLRTSTLASSAALTLAAPLVQAQAPWPEKLVRIVAAGPAGGSAEIVARVLADQLGKQAGQAVIVEPRPGAGGVLAVNDLSLAPHDGYTLLVGVNSLASENPHIVKLKTGMATEIKPLAEVARGGLVLVGNPSLPVKSLPALITYVKANPGKVNFASYTAGTL
jgi:tripartite-type tricarboxylate transporter receptor subunit TctC